ncbi:hypothetical protein [Sphingobium sp. CFD-2]|uniref:hypothetical protein n=1 Tax=Sphingobium sp. CFD-2 TaxID=2878542 RepID=UPI00214C30A4|nr:hypothetical protein [Sphingobium sp. CFD-2]
MMNPLFKLVCGKWLSPENNPLEATALLAIWLNYRSKSPNLRGFPYPAPPECETTLRQEAKRRALSG